ncbi:unnamed protein product [Ceutorhynchus assimilis]|uniref:Uncharacterized protein n=1 Tax=Ceutorhynchus assimilis TaxID=467358 RepID=A0A9N9MYQ9_9CUCU|nr:unnamed protein product [Ceutorhynchus assimilis]
MDVSPGPTNIPIIDLTEDDWQLRLDKVYGPKTLKLKYLQAFDVLNQFIKYHKSIIESRSHVYYKFVGSEHYLERVIQNYGFQFVSLYGMPFMCICDERSHKGKHMHAFIFRRITDQIPTRDTLTDFIEPPITDVSLWVETALYMMEKGKSRKFHCKTFTSPLCIDNPLLKRMLKDFLLLGLK